MNSPQCITGPRERVKAPTTSVTSGSIDSATQPTAAAARSAARGPRSGVTAAGRPCTISKRPRDTIQRCTNSATITSTMDVVASVLCITGLPPVSDTVAW